MLFIDWLIEKHQAHVHYLWSAIGSPNIRIFLWELVSYFLLYILQVLSKRHCKITICPNEREFSPSPVWSSLVLNYRMELALIVSVNLTTSCASASLTSLIFVWLSYSNLTFAYKQPNVEITAVGREPSCSLSKLHTHRIVEGRGCPMAGRMDLHCGHPAYPELHTLFPH